MGAGLRLPRAQESGTMPHQRGNMNRWIQISKRNKGKFGQPLSSNHEVPWTDQIRVSIELLRKKAFLSLYIYIEVYIRIINEVY
jgi:hypothetical protein